MPAHTPDWRALQPSWRGGFLSYPNARYAPVTPYPYYYPSYYPYGSSYYGFKQAEPEPPETEEEAAKSPESDQPEVADEPDSSPEADQASGE